MKGENLKRRLYAIWKKRDCEDQEPIPYTTGEQEQYFCTDLGVRIVGRLETEIFDSHIFEEYTHGAYVPTS